MKKLLPLLLALVLCFSLVCVCVYADEDAAQDATNYLKNDWEKGTMGMAAVDKVSDPDGDYFDCTYSAPSTDGDIQKYHSPIVDVLGAVKDAMGDEDEVEVVYVFEARCTWQDDSYAGSSAGGRVLLRGVNSGNHSTYNSDTEESEWNEAWEEYLEEEELDEMFKDSSGNIMYTGLGSAEFTDEEWTLFVSSPMLVNKGHLNEEFLKGWNLCIDMMTGDFEGLKSIQFRNTGVYLADEYEEPEPEETPTPVPTPTPKTTPTPVPQTAAPTAAATDAPADDAEGGAGLSTPALIAIIAGAVVVVAAVVVVIVVKKKQGSQAE